MVASLPVVILAGTAGGLLAVRVHMPGGAMLGSMLSVIVVNMLVGLQIDMPKNISNVVYIGLGIVIGCMYRPGMFSVVRNSWPTLVLSTVIIISTGLFCAWLVCRTGVLNPVGAYLATSPGGMNVVTGLAGDMGQGAPVVVVYQVTRLYAIILLAPFVAPLMERWLR